MATEQYCSFQLAGLLCGIEVSTVQEIIRYQDITPIPLASREVRGLINLRGQIVTAIDLRQVLGLPAAEPEHRPMNVIVRAGGGTAFSLLVDRIGDVLDLDLDLAEVPPATLTGSARELIDQAFKLDGALLLALDVRRVIAHVAAHVAAA